MVALRLFSLLLAAVGFALPAQALVFPYEQVTQAGPNNIIDSNAESCDNSPFNAGTGVWANPGEGCYNRTGGKCSADPNHICDLQLIPKGRCTYGDLSSTGGPGGTNTCVWPHGAGRCQGDVHVGCVTDAYLTNPANTATGPSSMCKDTAGGANLTCDMTIDPYGGAFRADCACQGTDSTLATFETTVCGTSGGALKAVCSDGDPTRDAGGYGTGLGVELNLGSGNVSFANMGPSMNGDSQPTQSPPYVIENIPENGAIEPQRGAGNANRAGPAVPIVKEKTTDARDVDPNFNATLGVSKVVNFGDSYWNDWAFVSVGVTGTFNTHIVVFSCDPPVGFKTDVKIDPTPGLPNSGDEKYCSQMGRDGVAFNWSRDLTPAELAANPTCPPNCLKDFDVTTTELEAFIAAGLQDPDAGAQLAIQSGEGRQAGAGDSVGVAVVTSNTWLGTNDMRCKMGGWGNSPGVVGRCSDGPLACTPGAAGDTACAAQGGSCRACNGPYDAATNPLGLPIGYNTHGLPELDLVAGKRIGGIAGVSSAVRVPLFVVGTTGFAGSDFRDVPGDASTPLDLADMGLVDTSDLVTFPFNVGVGTGGTFTNPSTLAIGEACCDSGANIVWQPDAVGIPVTGFNRTFDRGPGADGIPGCMNDVSAITNGANACNQHLGKGNTGAKTDGFFATGKDDQKSFYTIGASGSVPASANRFNIRNATPAVVAHFSGAPYNYVSPNPFTVNTVAAFPFRDIAVFGTANTDILVKVDTTFCPMVGLDPACTTVCADGDTDGDGVCNTVDNCPTVPNGAAQAGIVGVGNQTDGDADGVGDACDNCTTKSNPRELTTCFTTATTTCGPWTTETGGQRDDDHDGYGNKCDAHFPGVAGTVVGAGDLAQFRASNGKSRTGDTCGTTGTRPCAIFDLDMINGIIGAGDLATFRTLNGKVPGPKCPTCPLPCTAGTAGTCGAIP